MRQILQLHPLGQDATGLVDAESGRAVGEVISANLAGESPSAPGTGWRVCWSGWVGESDLGSGWFERVPGQWLPSSRQAWKAVAERADAVEGIVLRPHARHLLSDGPGCQNWLREAEGRRLLLDPVSMLEPEMLPDADDHVERLLTTLGADCWGVVVSDVGKREEAERGRWCVSTAAGGGLLDMERFLRGVQRFVRADAVHVGLCAEDVAFLRTLE